jgi:hypothetical protein
MQIVRVVFITISLFKNDNRRDGSGKTPLFFMCKNNNVVSLCICS